jgi:ribosomal protein S4E
VTGDRLPQQQWRVDVPRVTQRGDRVVVTSGHHAGRTGMVVDISLEREGRRVHRYAVVLLDAAGRGLRLRRFTEGLLRILD